MIKLLQRFTYYPIPIYCVAFYSFFVHLTYKKDPYLIPDRFEPSSSVSEYSTIETRSREIKMVLDLKYRHKINLYHLITKSFVCSLDLEGKMIGHKPSYDEKVCSHTINTTINFNKKLLKSTLFGSIKLIKI